MKTEDIKLSNEERQKCEVWTRVMGYYRPVDNYNLGKQSEYKERRCFKEVDCDCNMMSVVNTTKKAS